MPGSLSASSFLLITFVLILVARFFGIKLWLPALTLPSWVSIVAIAVGGLIMTGLATHNYTQSFIGVILVCTGMITLTISEIFNKRKDK